MRTIIFGDVHGRPHWEKILDIEHPDKIVFLGDYVSSHESYTAEQQLKELYKIMKLQASHPDDIVMLRGNHDMEGMSYTWAHCYPEVLPEVREAISNEHFVNDFLRQTKWVHTIEVGDKKVICSHAGVSQVWLEQILNMSEFDEGAINALPPDVQFGFNGYLWDVNGESHQQPCTWIRPMTLMECAVKGFDQIVGHTQTYGHCIDVKTVHGDTIWLCDALQHGGYLLINDDKYIPKQINI